MIDSLSGVELVGSPGRLADVGTGAGFPGLVLAAALGETQVDLIESVGRKCDFVERAIEAAGLDNARAGLRRAENWAAAPTPSVAARPTTWSPPARSGVCSTLAELASPLLREGGALVAWKGRRDPGEEAELRRAAARLAMSAEEVRAVGASSGFEHRHLHRVRKTGPTPDGLPRRPGMAKKRPYGRD